MLNITDAEKELWRSARVKKNVYITFPELNISLDNSDIVKDSLELTESINSDTNLVFQGCIASKLKVTLRDFVTDVRNKYMEVTMSLGTGQNETTPMPIFRGYVGDQSNATHEDIKTKLTVYDPLKKAMDADVTTWYRNLSFPMTLKAFRNAFFTRVGLTQENANLVNDTLTINRSIDESNISGREIIRGICQLNGVFGQFGRDGIFHYRKLTASIEAVYPAEDLYPADDLYPSEANAQERVFKSTYTKISYQPYHTKLISRVIIVDANGAQGGTAGDTTGDTFYVQDNKVAWGVNGNQACQGILDVVKNISFTPATITAKGLPYLECGDIIMANTRINVVQSYITSRTLSGVQDLMDTFDSDSTQQRKAYRLSQATQISANETATATAQTTANVAQSTASTARSEAGTAQSTANTARGEASNAQNTANNAVQRVGVIEADYVRTASITAVNGRIDNLSATVATINNAYITRAQCQTIVSQSIQSYWAGLTQLSVSGNISCGSISQGGTTFTKKSHNVRLANGGTQQIIYLGFA